MQSNERQADSTDLEPSERSYLYKIPILCRTYTARIEAVSNAVGPHKDATFSANPFGVFASELTRSSICLFLP